MDLGLVVEDLNSFSKGKVKVQVTVVNATHSNKAVVDNGTTDFTPGVAFLILGIRRILFTFASSIWTNVTVIHYRKYLHVMYCIAL